MAEIYQLPDSNSGNAGMGNIPFSIPIGGMGGGLFGGNGFGNDIGGLIALAIVASIFGWNNGNGFGGFGGGNGQLGFLANQLNNDNGRDLIMQAVTSQGEASRTAIQTLSSMLGQDFNLVNAGVQNVQNSLQTLALQQAVSVPQIINSIQSGNSALAAQLAQCCCENRLATCEQTNTLQNTMNANGQRNVDAIADLKATMIQSFCDVKEREMQSKIDTQADIITQLRNAADNAAQTNQIIGYVNSVVAPLQKSVTEIENKIPNTVPVQWPQLTAVNTTPYVNGGFYGGFNGYYGNGFGGNITF
jgi:hypothetical protein